MLRFRSEGFFVECRLFQEGTVLVGGQVAAIVFDQGVQFPDQVEHISEERDLLFSFHKYIIALE